MKRRAQAARGAGSRGGAGVVVGRPGGRLLVATGAFDHAIQELTLPLRHEDIIRQQADEKDVDASLIAAVIYSESKFSDQTSSAGRPRPDADHARKPPNTSSATAAARPSNSTTSPIPKSTSATGPSPARTARTLRRQRGRRARRLQRGARQRRQVGGQRVDVDDIPLPRNPRLRRRGARQAGSDYRDKYAQELGY